MLAFFAVSAYTYCFVVNKAVLLGPILHCATTVVYAHAHKTDMMRNLAGLELNYWRAKFLPIVWILLIGILGRF